ncbi:PREDICTED: uncharacterized protein C10orf12 homolog [Pygoscelis adeliae]|uniref:uncharacterized protein C10orf12 homolog n=1 Tax=Pygoscelis adeliae TaxID=9238 RepID=UPI0004F50AD3|nr:PREDICTED: uncharacterized protein C10orf12 homolog [Pygoscelis adeliae]
MEASTCGSGCSQRSTESQDKGANCTESKPPYSSDPGQSGSDGPLHVTGQTPKQPVELKSLDRAESSSPALRRDFSELPVTRLRSASPKDSSTQGYLSTLNSSSLTFHHATKSLEGQQAAGHEQEAGVRKCEDNKEQLAGKTLVEGYISVKVANVNGSEDSLDGCLGSQKSSFRALPEESWDPGFAVTPPRRADKENTLQCSSKASLHQDLDAKEQDARPKQENHLHAVAKGKAGCHLHPADKGPLDKPPRKSKKASGLRINDYDNQCDVVYISQPITECHFESQRSVSSRKTARKSTRGYYFNGECCELPTVRTLVKSSRAEERGSSPALRTETLVSAKPPLVLSPSTAVDTAPLAHDDARDPAQLPGAGDAEPCELRLAEPYPRSPGWQAPDEPPATVDGASTPEPPATLQCVDVNKGVDAEPEAESSCTVGDGSLEQEEAVPASTALPEVSEGEAVLNNSPAGEKEPTEGEMPPEPDGSDAAGKDSVSSKDSLDKKRKKGRRVLVASDRCLRSQQSQSPAEGSAEDAGSSSSVQLPCLQIKLSKSPGAKRFKREVHLDGAASMHFPNDCFPNTLLKTTEGPGTGQAPESIAEQRPGEENGVTTRQTYKSILAKETEAEGENSSKDDPPANGCQSQPGETLEISVQADSEKQSILLPPESSMPANDAEQVDVKPGHASAKDEESSDSAMDTGKLESYEPMANSPPCPSSRGGSKHLPAKAAKHKKVALQFYNLRHAPAPVDTAKRSTPGKESMQAILKLRDECSSGNDDSLALEDIDMADSKPKFMEWCAEEENQELIAEFNAQYMKVQKGWIQLEKEVQPTPKVKNKADKLKEIWKSKKRTRKSRGSLEVQKLSPVQMLFMKAFKLSDICQWFLETTETRSLVIVKKLNTRLPGEIPPIKVPMQKYSSSSLYPSSLQAERLKKHLKKFAATTPARNNLKNQKLWAKIRENADKAEAEEATAPSQTSPTNAGAEDLSEDKTTQPAPSLPTQASTRILRKYSNLRGKLRAQHRVVKAEKKSDSLGDHPSLESKQSRKSVCINPLMSPKLALQIKADAFPAKSPSVDGAGKGRKGKSRKKRTLKESGSTQERSGSATKDKLPAKKASKIKHSELEKVRLPMRKGKENTSRRAVLPPGHEELAKSPKQKPLGESSTRSQKMANKKPSGGKTLTRSMKKMQESSGSQGKRKLRAKMDCSHSKRSRLDPK